MATGFLRELTAPRQKSGRFHSAARFWSKFRLFARAPECRQQKLRHRAYGAISHANKLQRFRYNHVKSPAVVDRLPAEGSSSSSLRRNAREWLNIYTFRRKQPLRCRLLAKQRGMVRDAMLLRPPHDQAHLRPKLHQLSACRSLSGLCMLMVVAVSSRFRTK